MAAFARFRVAAHAARCARRVIAPTEFAVFRKGLGAAKESRPLNSQFSERAWELRRNRAH
jgi:hypothetical protein